jgi:hypothetical protein
MVRKKTTDRSEFDEFDIIDIFYRIAQNLEEIEYPFRWFVPMRIDVVCSATYRADSVHKLRVVLGEVVHCPTTVKQENWITDIHVKSVMN